MNEHLERIEDSVATLLGGDSTDKDTIIDFVKKIAAIQQYDLTKEEITLITYRLQTRFDIHMDTGSLLAADGYEPWLDDARGDIDPYYWKRYKRLLSDNGFSPNVIHSLDIVSDKIIDHLENPKKEGSWSRKGLVVGHVQSGKTANYTGVIAKAADSGYKVIIVLAGLLNPLRNQTQERIDEGFIGLDSSKQLENTNLREKLIGVGIYDSSRTPVPLTTSTQDFKNTIATQLRTQIDHFNEPVVFVLKKNVSILKNLINWLKSNNLELNKVPMLLIDDEADHASVNTNKEDEDPTTTNKRIRELLSLFDQRSYLGYTATPFANIFIDPDNEDEMLNDDLFPRDFIISLDAPSNYVGAKRIFNETSDLDILRKIKDYGDILPLKHKKEDLPQILPPRLKEAIRSFILIKASRNLRGQKKSHNSMLINVSRFTAIQSHIKILVHDYLTELRDSITNHYALPEKDALKNSTIVSLKNTWDKEFNNTEFSWRDIQKELKSAAFPIKAIEVNSSSNSEPLDYSKRHYPSGRNLIAVGGLSLSRGLTLEGLTVSYFLRNSIMYDTLMQMGRWFGYRTDFEDLCRIYMSEEAISWYTHISQVTEELRGEFAQMESVGMTPNQYGLSVRRHPESLIVTARNKMRTSKQALVQIDLEGRLVETTVLSKKDSVVDNNWNVTKQLIKSISENVNHQLFGNSYLFNKVSIEYLDIFFKAYINHPASTATDEKPITEYMNWLSVTNDEHNFWDVLLLNKTGSDSDLIQEISSLSCKAEFRNVIEVDGNAIRGEKQRFGSEPDQRAGLDNEDIEKLLEKYRITSDIPSKEYRKIRKRPLLILHILDCHINDKQVNPKGVISYEISFPGEANSRRPKKLVSYETNLVYWKTHYGDIEDE